MLENHAKLIQFFSVSDELVGRKKLQKMIYILKKNNIPFEEKYEFHFYGPYSEELTLRIEELCNLGFLSETKEDRSNYYQYRYKVTEQGQSFLDQFNIELPPLGQMVSKMKEKSSRFLELVSTILYFDNLSKDEVEEKVQTVKKKQNYTADDLEEAWSFIHEMNQLATR
ncbi:YwgA family protein [Radiobacillus kanasensis]|uniref:YwgA family protein n=1 Tax=Radiobacillus kanasensis TaxID=2844358 RepID=UPI001E2D87CA|nr:YwgA family protein [Radiobacillus kanasensis]UFT98991.1 YwgA family protein [Radiobacillus kanasensis]